MIYLLFYCKYSALGPWKTGLFLIPLKDLAHIEHMAHEICNIEGAWIFVE